MKYFIRKGISALLALAMLCSMTVFAANFAAPADAVNTNYEEAASMLTTLGIMTVNEEEAFLGNEPVTRAEFAQVMVRLLGLSSIVYSSDGEAVEVVDDEWEGSGIVNAVVVRNIKFNDVPMDHWAYSFIEVISGLGFMAGDGDNNFMPDEYIMYQDAIVVMTKILGYGVYAETDGGYPAGYLATAARNGINVEGNPTAAITKGQLANLIVDCFDVDFNVQTGFGEEKTYQRWEGYTILNEYLDIEEERGTVTGTAYTGVYSALEAAPEGMVSIDNIDYVATGIDSGDMLGKRVTYYYKEKDGIRTLVYYKSAASDNKETVIAPEDLASQDDNSISYFVDGREKRVTIDPSTPVILNEVYKDIVKNIDFLSYMDYPGEIRLLDSDGDSKTDAVFVTSYKTYIVKEVDTYNMRIFVRDVTKNESISVIDTPSGKQDYIPVNVEEYGYVCRIFKGEKLDTISAIAVNNVLSVATSENTLGDIVCTIRISTKTARGTMTEMTDDKATIGGNTYTVLPNVYMDARAGSEGTFYIDVFGYVVGFAASEGDYSYAYLMDAALEGNNLVQTLHLRMFTQKKAAVETFAVTDEIQFISQEVRNGEMVYGSTKKSPEEIFPLLATVDPATNLGVTNRQIIAYRTDADNNLISICLARVYNNWQETDSGIIPQRQPVGILSTITNADGTAGPGVPATRRAYREQFGEFIPSKSAFIFDLRSQYTDDWRLISRETFRSGNEDIENVSAYNIGDASVADIVLIEPTGDFIVGSKPGELTRPPRLTGRNPFFVSSVVIALNDDGEEVKVIRGYEGGTEKTFTIDYDIAMSPDNPDFNDIQVGDIWVFEGNAFGEINLAQRILSANQNWATAATFHKDIVGASAASYLGECDISLAKVLETGDNALLLAADTVSVSGMFANKLIWPALANLYSENDTRVVEYDVKNKTIKPITFSEIMMDDLVFTYATDAILRGIMVIRNYED